MKSIEKTGSAVAASPREQKATLDTWPFRSSAYTAPYVPGRDGQSAVAYAYRVIVAPIENKKSE